jgi:exodeoxyribonuclease VII small subunit
MCPPVSEVPAPSFEALLKELEGLITRFENNQLSLDEAVTAYERGIWLHKECLAKLQDAKTKMETVMAGGDHKAGEPGGQS